LFPAIQSALPGVKPIERRSTNVWEDEAARSAVLATNEKRLIVAGFLTEACVCFLALSALKEVFEVFVAGDTCGGLTATGHDLAIRRMEADGAQLTGWIQVLLEFQRDWTRHVTYEPARAILWRMAGATVWDWLMPGI
jgi:nicotinamidase-related amidase